jgi:hypothetical protein
MGQAYPFDQPRRDVGAESGYLVLHGTREPRGLGEALTITAIAYEL